MMSLHYNTSKSKSLRYYCRKGRDVCKLTPFSEPKISLIDVFCVKAFYLEEQDLARIALSV